MMIKRFQSELYRHASSKMLALVLLKWFGFGVVLGVCTFHVLPKRRGQVSPSPTRAVTARTDASSTTLPLPLIPATPAPIKTELIDGLITARSFAYNYTQNGLLPCPPYIKEWKNMSKLITNGVLYTKVHKCASTTSASVAIRLARRIHHRQFRRPGSCAVSAHHGWATGPRRHHFERNPADSILWSMVRIPTKQAISQFFHFDVTRQGHKTDDASVIDYFRQRSYQYEEFQTKYLAMSPTLLKQKNYAAMIQDVMDRYDFIGIVERIDESYVALAMILGLEPADVLYVSSKISGGYDDGQYNNTCYKIVKSVVSPVSYTHLTLPTKA